MPYAETLSLHSGKCRWAFGSRPLYPVATGLLLAVALAAVWIGLARKPMRLARHLRGGEHLEGDDLRIDLDLEVEGSVPLPAVVLVEELGKLGKHVTPMRSNGRRLTNLVAGGEELVKQAMRNPENSNSPSISHSAALFDSPW